jgi:iodotyrosine deiodinase
VTDTPPPPMRPHRPFVPATTAADAAESFLDVMRQRRSVRHFSDRPVPRELVETLIAAAGTAPSGANKQPWRFVAVSDPEIKREIRLAAEAEERQLYEKRANEDWLRDLAPLGTDWDKPYLEVAPWLIVIFKLVRDDEPGRRSDQVYYVNESVGLATGMFLAAAQHAGLATLTHTPSPMAFLSRILERPAHERPFLLVPLGHPADDCVVPEISRKPLDRIMVLDRSETLPPPTTAPRPSSNPPRDSS